MDNLIKWVTGETALEFQSEGAGERSMACPLDEAKREALLSPLDKIRHELIEWGRAIDAASGEGWEQSRAAASLHKLEVKPESAANTE